MPEDAPDPSTPPAEPAATWGSSFVPDTDDARPFPEVSEDRVDAELRQLLKAAREKREAGNFRSFLDFGHFCESKSAP